MSAIFGKRSPQEIRRSIFSSQNIKNPSALPKTDVIYNPPATAKSTGSLSMMGKQMTQILGNRPMENSSGPFNRSGFNYWGKTLPVPEDIDDIDDIGVWGKDLPLPDPDDYHNFIKNDPGILNPHRPKKPGSGSGSGSGFFNFNSHPNTSFTLLKSLKTIADVLISEQLAKYVNKQLNLPPAMDRFRVTELLLLPIIVETTEEVLTRVL